MTRFVLLAHGSRDPRGTGLVQEAAEALARRTGLDVVAAFLDPAAPSLAQAVDGAREAVVLPLLLASAFHATHDVPAATASTGVPVTLIDPIGHPPVLLDHLLASAGEPVVLVAAGTSDADERERFLRAVNEASRRTGVPASGAFATGPGPRASDAAPPCAPAVVAWLLAPGRLLDTVRQQAHEIGAAVHGDGLLREPVLRQLLAERIEEAARQVRWAGAHTSMASRTNAASPGLTAS